MSCDKTRKDTIKPHIAMIPPDQIRTFIEQERAKFKGTHDMNIINHLRNYAKLFPDSKWLSEAERIWLNRDDDDFVIYNYWKIIYNTDGGTYEAK